MVFRYVVNVQFINSHSDLGPFSPPQRPSPILNVGSMLSYPSRRFMQMPSPHSSAAHNPRINRTPATTKTECLLSLMDVRDLLATLGHEYNYPHFRPILRNVEQTCMPIDYHHAFLMTPETVFRYVVNIRLISYHSDLGPFSPLRPGPRHPF